MRLALTYFVQEPPSLYTTVSKYTTFLTVPQTTGCFGRGGVSPETIIFSVRRGYSRRVYPQKLFFLGEWKSLLGVLVRGEMGPNIFCPRIPPLYTTVSIDYLLPVPQTTSCFGRGGVGPRTKIFSVRRGYSRGDTVPPGSFFLLSVALHCCFTSTVNI